MPPLELPASKTKSAIRDHGGNQIVMEGADGVQQIQLFSPVANTKISMGAPNSPHELVCTSDGNGTWTCQGNNDFFSGGNFTMKIEANKKEEIKATWETVCHGDKIEKVVGPVKLKWDGLNYVFHGGLNSETFIGLKVAYNFAIEISDNFASRIRKTKGPMKYDSSVKLELEGGPSKIVMDGSGILLESGGSKIELKNGGTISVRCTKLEIDAEVVDLSATDKFDVYAAKTNFHGSRIDFMKATMDNGKQGTLFGG
jgi:hypothetical protein